MSEINDKVSELTTNESMFTAYDVTVSLRNDGHFVKHSDVKRVVHDLYDNQDMDPSYDRTLATVPGTSVQAYLYHHVSSDTDEYEPVAKNYSGKGTIQTTSAPITKAPMPGSLPKGSKNKQPVDGVLENAHLANDGRLNIPKRIIDESDLNGQVQIVKVDDEDLLWICEDMDEYDDGEVSLELVGTVTITDGYDVRISSGIMSKMSNSTFKIIADDDRIVIE